MNKSEQTVINWEQINQNSNKNDLLQRFYEKAIVEQYFDKHLNIVKQLLHSENLLYDNIKIEFSSENFTYVVIINFESVKNFYNKNLKNSFVSNSPTANIKDAIESTINILKGYRLQNDIPTKTEESTKEKPKEKIKTATEATNEKETKK